MRVRSSRSSIKCDSIFTLRRIISSASRVGSGKLSARKRLYGHHNWRQRRPQFVRQHGKETILCSAGSFQLITRDLVSLQCLFEFVSATR